MSGDNDLVVSHLADNKLVAFNVTVSFDKNFVTEVEGNMLCFEG